MNFFFVFVFNTNEIDIDNLPKVNIQLNNSILVNTHKQDKENGGTYTDEIYGSLLEDLHEVYSEGNEPYWMSNEPVSTTDELGMVNYLYTTGSATTINLSTNNSLLI